jgi:hypothetical protein
VSDQQSRQEAEQVVVHLFQQHVKEIGAEGRVIGPVINAIQADTVTVDQDEMARAQALSGVAPALAQVGDRAGLGRAVAAAEAMRDEMARAQALSGVAPALAQVGDQARAVEVTNQARAVVEAIGDEMARAWALGDVAQALAQAGDRAGLGRAGVAAAAIRNEEGRARALGGVAQALAQMGEHAWAMQLLRTAFAAARHAGRESVFKVLAEGASTLAAIDQGETLWLVYEAMCDVDRWWEGKPRQDIF